MFVAAATLLLLVGCIFIVFGGLWLVTCAFTRSVWWGLGIFVPLVGLVYALVDWSRAKWPFLITVLGGGLVGGAIAILPPDLRDFQKLHVFVEHRQAEIASTPPPERIGVRTPPPLPSLTADEKDHLARLQKREADLVARKAALQPGDAPATEALTREIAEYNQELQPLLERKKAVEAASRK